MASKSPDTLAEIRTQRIIEAYLAKPPVRRRVRADAHNWSLTHAVCDRCGITLKQFHNVRYGLGLPCKVEKVSTNGV